MAARDHFTRTPENKASELEKNTTYAKTAQNANKGYNNTDKFADDRPRSEVHHIVCEISVTLRFEDYKDNGLDDATVQYIEDCLWITKWDINNVDNLVGMPRNRRFRADWASTTDETKWTPLQWPSHQVDHLTTDGYTDEVQAWLYKNVWSTVRDKRKKHETSAEAILKALKQGETHFHGQLTTRGTRPPGKKDGWKNRHEESYAKKWYKPFSMGKKPRHREPGAKRKYATGLFNLR
ncbi:hypothetical protein WMF45_28050 [Sorangium sp. So ce448]|uniref:hypothetical protein n=1 Tax=Sorangium sp. So ce448 TaxID=3133314 RepID=UPI003F61E868